MAAVDAQLRQTRRANARMQVGAGELHQVDPQQRDVDDAPGHTGNRDAMQFHHSEKLLLCARGVLRSGAVRPVTIELDPDARRYLDRLILELLPMLS